MAMGEIESFNEAKNLARVFAGFKGSDWFQKGAMYPKLTFVDGYPPEVPEKFGATMIPQGTPTDPWNMRRR